MEKPKQGERIKVLPRVDASEVPTDSDRTVPDAAAYEPATVLDMKRKERVPEEKPTNMIMPITAMAVLVLALVIYALLR